MENKNQYLTTADISKILEITPVAVQKWISGGRLEAYRVGGNYRIRPNDLLKYLKDLKNSDYAMKEFKIDIKEFLEKKALTEKGSKVKFDIFSNKGEKNIVGSGK